MAQKPVVLKISSYLFNPLISKYLSNSCEVLHSGGTQELWHPTFQRLKTWLEKNKYATGGKHKACGLNLALHLVLSGLAPCFYPVAVPSSRLTVKEGYIYTVLKLHSAL